jgi:hypothetical protein
MNLVYIAIEVFQAIEKSDALSIFIEIKCPHTVIFRILEKGEEFFNIEITIFSL